MRRLVRTLRWPTTTVAVAAAVLWLVSHHTAGALPFGNTTIGVGLDSIEIGRGNASFRRTADAWICPQGPGVAIGPTRRLLPSTSKAQIWLSAAPSAPPTATFTLDVTYIPLASLTALLGLLTLVVWVAAARRQRGHCQACDYDLRGLAPSRCPECGGAIEGHPQSAAVTKGSA